MGKDRLDHMFNLVGGNRIPIRIHLVLGLQLDGLAEFVELHTRSIFFVKAGKHDCSNSRRGLASGRSANGI